MLLLTRKVGEEITIGDDIKIIISSICSGKVTLGIEAPQSYSIKRPEMKLREKKLIRSGVLSY